MKTFLHIRIFSHPWKGENGKEHSYYVDHEAGGLSERLGSIAIEPTITFTQLREVIEEIEQNGVRKRSQFFIEFLNFLQRCPNPLGYEGDSLKTYRIGTLKMTDDKGFIPCVQDISIIQEDVETEPVCEIVGEFIGTDLVLIPTSQIHPMTGHLSDQL